MLPVVEEGTLHQLPLCDLVASNRHQPQSFLCWLGLLISSISSQPVHLQRQLLANIGPVFDIEGKSLAFPPLKHFSRGSSTVIAFGM